MENAKQLLIVDDHLLFLHGMTLTLNTLMPEYAVTTANTFEKTIEKLNANLPSLLLIDLRMPDQDGLESIKKLRKSYSELLIVVLSASEDIKDMKLALEYGAQGYINKASKPETVVATIYKVLSGEDYFPHCSPNLGDADVDTIQQSQLTTRQNEILKLISIGYSNKEISNELFISIGTVKQHINTIFKVIGVKNRTQASKLYNLSPKDFRGFLQKL